MIVIRPEQNEDAAAIREIDLRAFGGRDEADLVDRLRVSCHDAISLVATIGDLVVGHILFTPVVIQRDHREVFGMGLAPMSVLPELQRHGIGSRLVEGGLEAVRAAGAPFVVVLGHPQYYPRFGFVPASRFQLMCEFEVPDEKFMVLAIRDDPDSLSGVARYHREFDVFK